MKKVWGKEVWFVNEPEYCCKVLCLNKDAHSSLHFHTVKKETFLVLSGKIKLERSGTVLTLSEGDKGIVIKPRQLHRFSGIEDSVILEVSTHHDDDDVMRLEVSKK